jgi:protein gp37
MGITTGISWTDHTANFWFGCMKVSPGCTNCYAETTVTGRMRLPVWGPPKTTDRKRAKGVWKDVRRWNDAARVDGARRRMFVSSLSDIFEDHPMVAPWRMEALALLEELTNLDIQLLTKRPENVRRFVPRAWMEGMWPRHIWIGTTVEDTRRAVERLPELLALTQAPIRFLSMEPLLEGVTLRALPVANACVECKGTVLWNVLAGRATCITCGQAVPPPALWPESYRVQTFPPDVTLAR